MNIANGTVPQRLKVDTATVVVFVYKRTGTTWAQKAYIKAANSQTGNNFRDSVAVSGNTVVASAPGEDSSQATISNSTSAATDNDSEDSGAVYVYIDQ